MPQASASRWRPWLALCRVSNLPTVWSNVAVGVVLAHGPWTWLQALSIGLSMSSFYAAGMCLNDIVDARHDETANPWRPIPRGQITLRAAWGLTLVLGGIGIVSLALGAHPRALPWAAVLAVFIAAYDLWHKKHTWTVALMGGCRALVVIIAASGVSGGMSLAAWMAAGAQGGYIVLLTLLARAFNAPKLARWRPVVPLMLAAISLLDGALLWWKMGMAGIAIGVTCAIATFVAGRLWVRGD